MGWCIQSTEETVNQEFYIQEIKLSEWKRGKWQGCLLSPFLLSIILEFLARAIKQASKQARKNERKKERHSDWKRSGKTIIFRWPVYIYNNTKESRKKNPTKLINKFTNVAGYKI